MIINTHFPNHASHASHAVETEASCLLLEEVADDCSDDALDVDMAEIRRMVELSGMFGLECRLLDRD